MVNKRIKKLAGLVGKEGVLSPSARRKVIMRKRLRRRKMLPYSAKPLTGLSKAERAAVVQRRRSMIQQSVDKTFRKTGVKGEKPNYTMKPDRGYMKGLSTRDKFTRGVMGKTAAKKLQRKYRSDYSIELDLAEFARAKRQRPLPFNEWSRLYGKGKGKEAYVKYTKNFYGKNPTFRPKPKSAKSRYGQAKQIGVGGVTPSTPSPIPSPPTPSPKIPSSNPVNNAAKIPPKRKGKIRLGEAAENAGNMLKNIGSRFKGLSTRNKILIGLGGVAAIGSGVAAVKAIRQNTREERDKEYQSKLRETYSSSPYYGTSVDRNIRRVHKTTESARNISSAARGLAYTVDTITRLLR